MPAEVLPFAWPEPPSGPLTAAVDRTLDALRGENRLTPVHEATIAGLYKLADALEHATTGRGASVALLAAQYFAVLDKLESLPSPVNADETEYDVVLLPVMDDAS